MACSLFRVVGPGALALLLSGCDCLTDRRPDVIYLIPQGFSGWMCVDFDVKNAPALPREGTTLVVRSRVGEVLQTSEKAPDWRGEVWVEIGSARTPLPTDVHSGWMMGATGPNEPFQRMCRFVGTFEQKDAAGNPPGLEQCSDCLTTHYSH